MVYVELVSQINNSASDLSSDYKKNNVTFGQVMKYVNAK